jgi:hypothetical protein
MRRLVGVVLLFSGMLGFQSIAHAQGVKSSIKIDKVNVKDLGKGKGCEVTVTATLTLTSTAGSSVKGTTFYFRDNNNNVSATATPFTPPTPGNSVTITYQPFPTPTFGTAGSTWTAHCNFYDSPANNFSFDSKTFTLP